MRKLFSLIAAVLFAGSMMATEVVFTNADFAGQGTANTGSEVTATKDGVTFTYSKGYSATESLRCYAHGALTISAESTIEKINFTTTGDKTGGLEAEVTVGATTYSVADLASQARFTEIKVTLGGGVTPPAVATPVISGDETFTESVIVTITCSTPEADIYYTTDGTTDPKCDCAAAPEYTQQIVLTETTTIMAAAYTGNDWSAVATKTFTKVEPAQAITCLEVYQKAKNDAVLLNPVTVTYSNGANVWVMDGSASMLIYLPSGFTNNFQAGDVLSGIAGVVDIYQNIVYEVKPDATQAAAIVATPGEAPAPSQRAVIEATDVNQYVILPGFSIEGEFTAASKTSLPAALGTDTVTIYNNFKLAYTFEAGKTYDIIGVVSAYKGNPQVYFISAEEVGGEVPPTPSINYYVAGSMNGWAANEAYILTPNNENLYQGEFTFAANDEFKVIGFDGETTTWFPTGMGNNFQITEAGDYKITFNPAGNVDGWHEGFFNVVKKEEPVALTIAQAIAAGMALDSAATSEADYTIEGYVVNAQPFSLSYGNQIWYMADDAANTANQEFQAYGCVAIENNDTLQVLNGDKVQLTGKLFKYYNKSAAKYVIEVKNGTAAFVTKAEGDHSIDKGVEQLTVAGALAIGADLAMGATSTKTYEITGYVTVMAGKETDYEQYGNQTFWIADENNGADSNAAGAFEVYRGKAPQAVKVGDLVKVKTAVKKYNDGSANGLIESESNAAVTIIGGEPVEEADVEFASADFNGQGTSGTGSEVTATKNGVTFTCNKAFGDQYGVRCYKGANVSITSAEQQIGKIVFEFATVGGTYHNGDLDEEIVVNGMEWSAENLSKQARMNKIKIYFGEYEQQQVDTLTAAEALAAAQALEVGATQKVVCKAYIANVKTPYDEQYGNITVYLTDDPTSTYGDIQAYRAKCSAEDGAAIAEHDLVLIEGNVTHTQNQEGTKDYYEFASGAQLKLLQKAEGIENVVLTEQVEKVVVDGVIYIIRDNKLFNLQGAQVR